MSITRHETTEIYSKAAEANGFVFTAGIVPSDLSRDVKGQTEEVLSEIDRLLALAGTSKSKVVQATIWLAVVQKSVEVAVKGGENKGKTLTYYNVVRELTPVGAWSGKAATIQLLRSAFMRTDIEDIIVLIQESDYGPIIGAAWLGL